MPSNNNAHFKQAFTSIKLLMSFGFKYGIISSSTLGSKVSSPDSFLPRETPDPFYICNLCFCMKGIMLIRLWQCVFKSIRFVNTDWQRLQVNGLGSGCFDKMWRFKSNTRSNLLIQYMHPNSLILLGLCIFICCFVIYLRFEVNAHTLQL